MILDSYGQPYKIAHAADTSYRRGPQFAVRNDDIERLIPAGDRKTLTSLSNRLFTNMGVPRACILQKADYSVGEAWIPSYLGKDQERGKQVAKFIHDIWLPQADIRGGVFDWWKLLELSSVEIDRAGDVFWLMVKGKDNFPRIQMIPNHRCYSGTETVVESGEYKGYRICDGVIYYSSGQPAAYRFNIGKDGEEKMVDLPAKDVIHLFDATHCDQGRGLPAFTHALESLKMSLLSLEDERVRQQIISRLHLTIFNDAGAPDIDETESLMSGSGDLPNPMSFTSKSFPGGVMYMPADGKQRIEQMRHENPGEIWESFQDRMMRDSVIPVWSYSVWKGSTQGTDVRAEVVKCRRFITKRQGLLWYGARRAMAWAYSVFAENGRLPKLDAPTLWDFSRPPRLSVDDGRESSMEVEEVRVGTKNISEVLEARGLNEDDFIESRARSVWNRKYKAKIIAEELNKKYGQDIEIEEREMFMLTANEMGEQSEIETKSKEESQNEND
jgi:hypothetical protein